MEGQGSKSKAKAKAKAELTAVSMTTPTPDPNLASTAYLGDLSCAMMDGPSAEEMSALLAVGGNSTNCLDSETSSHMFKDIDVFWTYNVMQA